MKNCILTLHVSGYLKKTEEFKIKFFFSDHIFSSG